MCLHFFASSSPCIFSVISAEYPASFDRITVPVRLFELDKRRAGLPFSRE